MGKNNKRPPYRKNPRFQPDKRVSFKKGKRQNFDSEKSEGDYNADETVYRILCPVKKIGSVIGKGGDIIKALREETHAKIKVGESVPGTDERVVIIFSSSTKKPRISDNDEKQEAPESNDATEEQNQDSTEGGQEPDSTEGGQEPDSAEGGQEPDSTEGGRESDSTEGARDPVSSEGARDPDSTEGARDPDSTEGARDPDSTEGAHDPDSTEGAQDPDSTEGARDPDSIEGARIPDSTGVLDSMEPHCPAQHALLKVHERIAEDDGLFGGPAREESGEDDIVTARLLVPSNQVGCLLGKGGHVIQKLRTETGANIRILPEDHLPACALSTDELVQISGTLAISKKALYEVSTLLHQNPRPPMKIPAPDSSRGFYPPAGPAGSMPPKGNPMFQRNSGFRGPPPGPWESEFPRFPPGGAASAEFTMKILCPADRIGVVIGKGGSNVRQMQHETGTDIHVEHTNADAEERAILVSALDAPWNPISPTIEAILLLQSKISIMSEEGTITTRLLVPSSKVGCLLGQGGHIINEMRRRSHADIRIFSKEGKPDYAAMDEELVQVSGYANVARDALTEVASRLRMRSLEGTNGAAEPGPPRPFHGYGRPETFPERRLPPPGMAGARSAGGYEQTKGGGHEFESQRYPKQPYPKQSTPAFPNINSSMQVKIPNSAISSVLGVGGSNISNIGQMSGAKVKLNDPQAGGGSECIVEIHGSFEQMSAAQNLLQNYISSSTQNINTHQHAPHTSAAQSFNAQPHPQAHQQPQPYPSSYASAIPNTNAQHQQNPYASSYASSMQISSAQQHQSSYASAAPSLSSQHHQSPYASAAPSYGTQQQQQSPYASALPGYSGYQQQQQSSYPSSLQNYNSQPQEQSSYPPVPQSYDGQQQAPYQY